MASRHNITNSLSIQIPTSPSDEEVLQWFAEQEHRHRYYDDQEMSDQGHMWCSRAAAQCWRGVASLSKELETTVHHIAHWMMLWSQGHYLGQMLTTTAAASAAAAWGEPSAEAPSAREFSMLIVGIVLVALGIIASGFVVATEFPSVCTFLGIRHGDLEAQTVRRWCMLLSGSCSFMFSSVLAISTLVFPLMPTADRADAGFFIVFRATGILWGAVSGFLWFSLAHRELKAAGDGTTKKRWSAFDAHTEESDTEVSMQPATCVVSMSA